MYQHMRLYEFSGSMKVLLTGFVLSVMIVAAVAAAAFYHACEPLDGAPGISFTDVKVFAAGADQSVLEDVIENPARYGLANPTELDRNILRTWCQQGAPREKLGDVQRVLKGTYFDRASRRDNLKSYRQLAALAQDRPPLSPARFAVGTAVYLAIFSVAFLGLGVLFVRSSLFEKTKLFFVGATFFVALAGPVFLWMGRSRSGHLYGMLLSGLLLAVCLTVFALVALNDLWFRRPAS